MSAWIFQSNPRTFRINQYLNDFVNAGRDVDFSIRQEHYRKKFYFHDEVFIWRSNGDELPGIIARGLITKAPSILEDDAPEYWITPDPLPITWRVKLQIKELRLTLADGMLAKGFLEVFPELSKLQILKFFQRANYLISDEEAKFIRHLWQARRNWTPPDPLVDLFEE
jgi:hypothetical protein